MLTIPTVESALAALDEAAKELRETMLKQVEAQFEADDILDQLARQKIGTTNDLTGRPHSYNSAVDAVKNEAHWRNCRREVVRLDGDIEWHQTRVERATSILRLAVVQAEKAKAA